MVDIRRADKGLRREKWNLKNTLIFSARLVLGTIFVYAAIGKIVDPRAFAEVVYKYQILPDFFINLSAIILPWMEVGIGLSLILGICLPGAVVLSNLLLMCFLGSIVFNMMRGLDVHCGCFSLSVEGTAHAPMAWYVTRDSLLLLPALYLFYGTFRGKRQTVEA